MPWKAGGPPGQKGHEDGAPGGPPMKKPPREALELQLRRQEELVRQRFANYNGTRAYEVTEVRALPGEGAQKDSFALELTVRPTQFAADFWPYQPTLFFGLAPWRAVEAPLQTQVFFIENTLVSFLGATVAILLSVIITAFFVPNMLRKGTVDLLLVKPIHRSTLLVYKYVGGLSFILLNTAFAVGGVWLVLGLRSGVWSPNFLLMIPLITFFFAILYAASALFGVLTRSVIASILLTCGVWFFLWVVGQAYAGVQFLGKLEESRNTPADERIMDSWWVSAINGVHFVLPRTGDLNILAQEALVSGLSSPELGGGQPTDIIPVNWGETLSVSFGFIGVMLGLACWRFSARDY
jgi:ABC-type transport system involved in multi-copper enzyme maturation permease subunit